MSDKTELLPCPFCNDEMKLDPGATAFASGPGAAYVSCDCGAMGPGGKTPDEAVTAWNRRATIQPAAAEPVGDDELGKLLRDIQQLEGLAGGTINALGSDNLLKSSGEKKATIADAKRILSFVVPNLKELSRKLHATAPVAPADAVRDARNEQDAARLDWLLPNLHPANFGFEFEGGYEWDSEAEFLAKFRKAIDAAMSTTPTEGQQP